MIEHQKEIMSRPKKTWFDSKGEFSSWDPVCVLPFDYLQFFF
jgi:hypothetical protein